ncbi:MAG: tetratricopeptide repeat protein, partial [Gammaproteobacteria bacterium]
MDDAPFDRAELLRLGVAAHRAGRLQEALQCYRRMLEADDKDFDALQLSGVVTMQAGDAAAALGLFDRAVQVDPGQPMLRNARGTALQTLGRFEAALAEFVEATRLKPDYAEAFFNRGEAARRLGRSEEALLGYAEASRLKPDHMEATFHRGNALYSLSRFEEALAGYRETLRLKPGHAVAFNNLGVTLQELGRLDEAYAHFTEAVRLDPGYSSAFANRARLQLLRRRFPAGFADHRHRIGEPDFAVSVQPTSLPRCEPDTLRGSLLLWAEQGLGDELFYAGLLPELLEREVSVTLSADKRLHALFARSFPQVRLLDRAVTIRSSIDSGYDAQANIGDLGHLLGIDAASLAATRKVYLKVDERRREEMRAKVAALSGRRVCGIAWRSAHPKF